MQMIQTIQAYRWKTLFYAANRTKPESDLYDAYKLVKSFRDGLQKALWVEQGQSKQSKTSSRIRKSFN